MTWEELSPRLMEYVHLAVRWFHVVAGVTWIGQTYLFHWMEHNLEPPEPSGEGRSNVAGNLWMVHGGGFYLVEKQKKPAVMPRVLHWFKYEALLTWVSGVILLGIVYYFGGVMQSQETSLAPWQSSLIGVGVLVFGFLLYDLACRTPLAKSQSLFGAVGFAAIVGLILLLRMWMSYRAAYFHIGALFGTIMVANVWMRILPGQRKMLNATLAGEEPDMSYGVQGKLRSTHNSYMSIPLIFIMFSAHFSTSLYSTELGWLILPAIILVGWVAAWVFLFRK